MVGIPWSQEIIAGLAKLASQGYSASQCAAQFPGMTRNSVVGIAHRRGFHFLGTSSGPAIVNGTKPRSRKATPPYMAVEIVPDDRAGMVTLMDLTHDACKWPLGDPQSPDFRFCGKRRVEGRPYCGNHCRVGYQPRG